MEWPLGFLLMVPLAPAPPPGDFAPLAFLPMTRACLCVDSRARGGECRAENARRAADVERRTTRFLESREIIDVCGFFRLRPHTNFAFFAPPPPERAALAQPPRAFRQCAGNRSCRRCGGALRHARTRRAPSAERAFERLRRPAPPRTRFSPARSTRGTLHPRVFPLRRLGRIDASARVCRGTRAREIRSARRVR
jgi:hypothetical protein